MRSLKSIVQNKKDILSVYFTAGYPGLDDTENIIKLLDDSGVDIIEVGIPYSDPIADGPVIQNSSSIALKNGINLDIVFEQLKKVKDEIKIALVIMAYLNQLLSYGVERFLSSCKRVGIQALIIPDLPLNEYESHYRDLFEKYEISNIFLVTPQTSEDRIRRIDDLTDSFIYLVSSSSITGTKNNINEEQKLYFKRIDNMNLKNPGLIGFGISNRETFNIACKFSAGAIIGSAFIKAVSKSESLDQDIKNFVKSIK